MIKGDYDRLKELAKFNMCSLHHSPLEVAWYGQEHTWVLRCDTCGYPDAVTRQLSLTQEYKAGADIPEPVKSNIEKGMRRRQMQQGKQPAANEFAMVPQTDLGTGELLVPEVVKALVEYARKYALDPARSHVVLMYSKPYITIDGYLYHALRSGIPYTLESRPLDEDERKTFQVLEGQHVWQAKVTLTESGSFFTGLGIVTLEEMAAKSPRDQSKLRSPVVAAHPWQLAQKRAEWQALRRAFPIGETEERKQE